MPGALDVAEVAFETGYSLADEAAVGFDLGFPGTAQEPETAALAFQVGPRAHQARTLIRQRRQLHLKLPLACAGTGPEDIQDEAGAVNDLALPSAFQVALLHGRQRRVDHRQPDTEAAVVGFLTVGALALPRGDQRAETIDGTQAHQRRGARPGNVEHGGVHDVEVDGFGEPHRFEQAVFRGAPSLRSLLHDRVDDDAAFGAVVLGG